jgi:hypothetical protein
MRDDREDRDDLESFERMDASPMEVIGRSSPASMSMLEMVTESRPPPVPVSMAVQIAAGCVRVRINLPFLRGDFIDNEYMIPPHKSGTNNNTKLIISQVCVLNKVGRFKLVPKTEETRAETITFCDLW